jgi:serine/threonine protein kinase/Tol biopolymer transport system component
VTLSAGARLGPYEIRAPLGAGGMGEVYRAKDPRLGREVAIKVLPASFSQDADRLRRFEQEARSASALNHPNIITIHDIGSSDSTLYIAMEFVDGQSLRQLMASGPMPTKKLLDVGVQIAEGLAKAHAAGIVHRDLKPENVMVSKDGFVKLLDFGLAKLFVAPSEQSSGAPTIVQQETQPGTVMGTVGYMSPEQASGRPVDFRSDQFSLGSILYEMATGRRAFQKDTGAETLSAIIRDEPDPVERVNPQTPAPLRWIVDRCLAKDADERYASTKDLARELKSIRDHLSEASVVSPGLSAFAPSRRRPLAFAATALAIGGALLIAAFLLGRRSAERPVPRYNQVTFRRGTVWTGRFSSDGHTILYGASFEASPVEIFEKREGSFESRPLGLSGHNLLSISRAGPLAISLGNRLATPFLRRGTLAELAPGGTSAPRELLNDVYAADWAPDGSSLAVVREVGGRFQLEYPIGKVLYQTAGWLSHARVSPDGERVAFLDHPIPNDDGGSVAVVDRSGRRKTLATGFQSEEGLAWSPDSREVWFTAARSGTNLSLSAVTLSGRMRLINRVPGFFLIQDISRDGRVLASRESWRIGLFGRVPGEEKERDLSWLDWSLAADMSSDGKMILVTEAGEGGGSGYSAYMRRTEETGAVRLGEGFAQSFSPDRRSIVAIVHPSGEAQLAIYPTGVGERRQLPREGLTPQRVDWMPDGRQLLVSANEEGKGVRLWLVDAESGKPRPISPEGFRQFSRCISSDGSKTVASGPDQRLYLYPLRGGEPSPLPDLTTQDQPSGWTEDGHSFFVFRRNELPAKIYRYDSTTGRKQLGKELNPPDPTGIIQVNRFISTPDGSVYVYNYQRYLSELYEVEGLR